VNSAIKSYKIKSRNVFKSHHRGRSLFLSAANWTSPRELTLVML